MTIAQQLKAMLKVCKEKKWRITAKGQIRTVESCLCPLQIYTGQKDAYRSEAEKKGMTWNTTRLVIGASDKWTTTGTKTKREEKKALRKRMLRAFGLKESQAGAR